MSELFSAQEIEQYMRQEVARVGGAREWLKEHRQVGDWSHSLAAIETGSAATLDSIRAALGFERITMYRPKAK